MFPEAERAGSWAADSALHMAVDNSRRSTVAALFFLLSATSWLPGQLLERAGTYDQALQEYRQGRLQNAEATLKAILQNQPSDLKSLELLGVVLDSGRRCDEAEGVYSTALKLKTRSASLWNNVGNHYVTCGSEKDARLAYERAIELEPRDPNANLQLAQIYLAHSQGRMALRVLDNLRKADVEESAVAILRARALYMTGQPKEADGVLARLLDQSRSDPHKAFQIGMIYAGQKEYELAEKAFARAFALTPTDFDILYNLGLAAAQAGHFGRATDAFRTALSQRPEDVDCLYNLSLIYAETGHEDQAIVLLVEAKKIAPQRTELLMLMARLTERLGFYEDTANVYDEYLKLRPTDDVARRERGFSLARARRLAEGLKDLEWYVKKYPKDAAGSYELAVAETTTNVQKAEEHFTQALLSAPSMVAARYGRALLYYRQGRYAESIKDLRQVLKVEPKNSHALDTLGESLLQLGGVQEAKEALEGAIQLEPEEPKFLMHYSRALFRAGRSKEAKEVLLRFEKIRPDDDRRQRRFGGLLQYLNLPESGQRAQYLTNLQRDVSTNPNDVALKIRLAKALLGEGKTPDALIALGEVRSMTSDPAVLADCGKSLLEYAQYGPAAEFLKAASTAGPPIEGLDLDLGLALFHSADPQSALEELEKTPFEKRQGDYYLLRAQILDAVGKVREAAEDLNRGFRASPKRPDLYFEAALFLIKHNMFDRALSLLQQADGVVPGHPELLLMKALALALSDKFKEAESQLTEIEAAWPEWNLPYLFKGTILLEHYRNLEAIPQLETAIALGARQPEAYYNLAAAYYANSSPADLGLADQAITQALNLKPHDADIFTLAGNIAFKQRRYEVALEHLKQATILDPYLVAAHESLSATYRALGDRKKSIEELQQVVEIKKRSVGADEKRSPIASLLFTVGPTTDR
jgi:tetratricopeptide (TPR) repeat protein